MYEFYLFPYFKRTGKLCVELCDDLGEGTWMLLIFKALNCCILKEETWKLKERILYTRECHSMSCIYVS